MGQYEILLSLLQWQLGVFDMVEPRGLEGLKWVEPPHCPERHLLYEQKMDLCHFKPLAFGGVCYTAHPFLSWVIQKIANYLDI